ncbi:MAG: S8 family peptidase [Mycobacteriales bacterium]
MSDHTAPRPLRPAGKHRLPFRVGAGLAVAAVLAAVSPALGDTTGPAGPVQQWIVQGAPGQDLGALVSVFHGAPGRALPLVGGMVASIDSADAAALAMVPGVNVAPDAAVAANMSTDTSTRPPAAIFPEVTGATQLESNGINGAGVTVAVLDTGIDPLPDFAGRLIGGVDFSGEGNPFQDSYGHGTFVAGLIAGNGASSNGQYMGEAPGANLVAIKVAGASGVTDEATVIDGINWAIQNRLLYNIRVLNISLGAPPLTPTALNPMDQAVEAAWRSGIVVVASAGNAGPDNGTILAPGDDPLAITAGAINDQGTVTQTDDTVPAFSSVGPTYSDGWIKPDLAASGRSVVSLMAPGSTIATDYPSAIVGTANFVGSGTSFSAAITSGAAALVLQANPNNSPDQVKGRLLLGTTPGPVGDPFVDGHGELNAYNAATDPPVTLDQSGTFVGASTTGVTVSLSLAWGQSTWNPANYSGPATDSAAWNSAAWNSAGWNSAAWNGSTWNGTAWNSAAWNSAAWNSAAWNGSTWNSAAWNGAAWNSAAWNSAAWNSAAWNSAAWN